MGRVLPHGVLQSSHKILQEQHRILDRPRRAGKKRLLWTSHSTSVSLSQCPQASQHSLGTNALVQVWRGWGEENAQELFPLHSPPYFNQCSKDQCWWAGKGNGATNSLKKGDTVKLKAKYCTILTNMIDFNWLKLEWATWNRSAILYLNGLLATLNLLKEQAMNLKAVFLQTR